MSQIDTICVYCGSGAGENPTYARAAETLGRDLAENGMRLVYGGGGLGLMGIVAKSVLKHDGQVLGIIPEFLADRERMLRDVQELVVTKDMHERKMKMFDAADAFVALPGGIGTLEELVEMLTWSQLGQHNKPVVIANIDGFWDPLIKLLNHMKDQSFIRPGLMLNYLTATRAEDILPAIMEAAQGKDTETTGTHIEHM